MTFYMGSTKVLLNVVPDFDILLFTAELHTHTGVEQWLTKSVTHYTLMYIYMHIQGVLKNMLHLWISARVIIWVILIRPGLLIPPCKRLGLYLSVSGCSTEGLVYHRAFPIELCDVYCAMDGDLVSLTRKLPIHKTHAHAFTRYRVTMWNGHCLHLFVWHVR